VAFAVAIAIHEVLASLLPGNWRAASAPEPPERITIARIIRIEHRPRPTPSPTPRPVRAKIIAPAHVAHVVNPGAAAQNHRIHRIASARPLVRTKFHSSPAPIHVVMGGHGSGTSTTAKAATGGAGPGGEGTGEGGNGNGTGGPPSSTEPCGFVDFIPTDAGQYDRKTGGFFEHISMTVAFPDGHHESVQLDYPWYYPNEAADPWSQANLKDPNFPTTFQSPPPDKASQEPALVQYVMQHSTATGFTRLKDCPQATPTP
jgi:hypothetical protein